MSSTLFGFFLGFIWGGMFVAYLVAADIRTNPAYLILSFGAGVLACLIVGMFTSAKVVPPPPSNDDDWWRRGEPPPWDR